MLINWKMSFKFWYFKFIQLLILWCFYLLNAGLVLVTEYFYTVVLLIVKLNIQVLLPTLLCCLDTQLSATIPPKKIKNISTLLR